MSNAILPVFPGLAWGVSKAPQFHTRVQTATSGRELRCSYTAYPKYTFQLAYEVLRPQEYQQLLGFFLARRGSWDSFLFRDPDDCTANRQVIGIGDGQRTRFPLLRALGGFVEPVENVDAVQAVLLDEVPLQRGSQYALTGDGVVMLASAAPAGSVLRWSGSFYYRCRFGSDISEYRQFMSQLWELKRLEMIGATGNKV